MRLLPIVSIAALLPGLGFAQTTARTNVKVIHNTQKTDGSTRDSRNPQRMFYTQAKEAHRGYGNVVGFVATLTDMDSSTTESVDFGLYSVMPNSTQPDRFQYAVYPKLNFLDPKNPKVKIQHVKWTITLAKPYAAPERIALYLGLGSVKMNGSTAIDGVHVHSQSGGSSRVPVAQRKDYAWYFDTLSPFMRPSLLGKGTTLDIGAIYDKPVLRQFIRSTRYKATPEDLYGLEAYDPDTAKGDTVGWEVSADQCKNGLAIHLLAGGLMAAPVSTGFGTLWMSPPIGSVQLPAVFLGAGGFHKSAPIAGIKGLRLFSQSACIELKSKQIFLSDLTEMTIR